MDLFENKQANTKSVTVVIFGTEGNYKSLRGPKTSANLLWYGPKEWKSLSQAKQDEILEWRQTKEGQDATQSQYEKQCGNSLKQNNHNRKLNPIKR